MPGARCTRGLACIFALKESAHEHTGSAEAFRHPLRDGFTAYFVLSLGTGLSCPHRRRGLQGILADLAPASGRRDHAISPYANVPFVVRHISVHRIPPHVS